MENSNVAKMIGEKIRLYRKSKGMTQEQLAELVGTHFAYIGKLERGEMNCKLQTLEKVAAALGINIFTLFDFDQFEEIKSHQVAWKAIELILEQSESDQKRALAILEALFQTY